MKITCSNCNLTQMLVVKYVYLFFKYQGGEERTAPEGEVEGGDAADTLSDLKDDDEDSVSALLEPPTLTPPSCPRA